MRILLVNWARIEDGASHGGGVNGYCLGIARGLARRGHAVASVASGMKYEAEGACRVEARETFEGIERVEVVNSPVLAPSMAQFEDPLGEVNAPALERCFGALLDQVRPEVVHFHNIEGYSAGCVREAKSRRIRTIYSLHNYHTLCPQVYLMQGHRRPCFSFDNGHACVKCIPTVSPDSERRKRVAQDPAEEPIYKPGVPPPPPWETIDRPAWTPLLNIVEPEPASSRPPNAYAQRRREMIKMLNSCDRVLAVSEFVRRKFESMGVRSARTLHIGTAMTEYSRQSPPPPPAALPLRIAFVGYHNWFKGLPMLLDSLELLTPEYLSRIHLTVLAINLPMIEPHLRRLEPRLAGLRTGPGYRPEALPEELANVDLGVVPSVWWDNGPQTVMEFLACGVPVLAAELGGIPDFVEDGVNGLLFRGTDRWDLARRLAELVRDPAILDGLRRGIRTPKTMAEHVSELEEEYGVS